MKIYTKEDSTMIGSTGVFSELGRFVRYVAPVLIMIIEILIYRILFDGKWNYSDLFKEFKEVWYLSILILISGTFISFIYQTTRIGRIDYSKLLNFYKDKFKLTDDAINSNSFATMSAIWYSVLEINKTIVSATKRSQQLANNLHGSGASLIACIIGYALFLLILHNESKKISDGCLCASSFAFILLLVGHIFHFRKVKEDHIIFVEVAFDISQNDEIIRSEIDRFK